MVRCAEDAPVRNRKISESGRFFRLQDLLDLHESHQSATLFFFASVARHELAHSLMAIRSGIEIKEITLFMPSISLLLHGVISRPLIDA